MVELISLDQCDTQALEALLDAAFGADRHGRTAYMLRAGISAISSLSFGLMDDGALIGSIQCWQVQIGDGQDSALLILVGPVAVDPARQINGHGHTLMHAALDAAAAINDPAMVLIGDTEYYGRFGFSADATAGWELPGPWERHRLLCRNPAGHKLPAAGMLKPLAR